MWSQFSFGFEFSDHRWRCLDNKILGVFSIEDRRDAMKSVHWFQAETSRGRKAKSKGKKDVEEATIVFDRLHFKMFFISGHCIMHSEFPWTCELAPLVLLWGGPELQGILWCAGDENALSVLLFSGLKRPIKNRPAYLCVDCSTQLSNPKLKTPPLVAVDVLRKHWKPINDFARDFAIVLKYSTLLATIPGFKYFKKFKIFVSPTSWQDSKLC